MSSEGSGSTGSDGGSSDHSGSEVACDITLIERLIRSHPIWFLPGIQRAGAFHLLQGKEEGVSIYTRHSMPIIPPRFNHLFIIYCKIPLATTIVQVPLIEYRYRASSFPLQFLFFVFPHAFCGRIFFYSVEKPQEGFSSMV